MYMYARIILSLTADRRTAKLECEKHQSLVSHTSLKSCPNRRAAVERLAIADLEINFLLSGGKQREEHPRQRTITAEAGAGASSGGGLQDNASRIQIDLDTWPTHKWHYSNTREGKG